MKKTNQGNMFSKYSETPSRKSKNGKKEMPLMTTYEQRYKGEGSSMSKELTDPKPVKTLDEKIKSREEAKRPVNNDLASRVSVEIMGHNYLLGSSDDISPAKIIRIAALANEILSESKKNNPGLTNSKITTLALIDACDRIISLQDDNSNFKTELMYYQSKLKVEDNKKVKEPTPMELLANEILEIDEE